LLKNRIYIAKNSAKFFPRNAAKGFLQGGKNGMLFAKFGFNFFEEVDLDEKISY